MVILLSIHYYMLGIVVYVVYRPKFTCMVHGYTNVLRLRSVRDTGVVDSAAYMHLLQLRGHQANLNLHSLEASFVHKEHNVGSYRYSR